MVGVICKDHEADAAREFFELFKIPWEFCVAEHSYDALIATSDDVPRNPNAQVVLVYNSRETRTDAEDGVGLQCKGKGQLLEWNGSDIPIYGEASTVGERGQPFLWGKKTAGIFGLRICTTTRPMVRVGYDLFQEVSWLLSQGQPPVNATIPTLEMHIALLRSMLISSGVSFVEIPPVPAGYDYLACLTHDVDFTGIRQHKFDHTMWGFVYRGLVGSLLDAITGRFPWAKFWQNGRAVLSLPLVHLGWKADFWLEFDRYMQIEEGLGSTFFFIPFPNYPGTIDSAPAPSRRAAKYDLREIKQDVARLADRRCEIGLHGIDAWQDSKKAEAELGRIRELTNQSEVGVRMHWLYFSRESNKNLEQAGLSYDSTCGYNDAVGFRAGTSQAFRPLNAEELLELPLVIQDSALFYPGRMHLSETQALERCKGIIRWMVRFGGVLVINWHTRSLSPERLWGDFYRMLLDEMRKYRTWFATAQDVVRWFRSRRALRFHEVQFTAGGVRLKVSGPSMEALPPLRVRVHCSKFGSTKHAEADFATQSWVDAFWRGEGELQIPAPGNETARGTLERGESASCCVGQIQEN